MKIYIIGPSGSGTTTLGKILSKELGIVHEDSDNFFWEDTNPPFTTKRSPEKLHELFNEHVSNPSFILSGDVLNWGLAKDELLNSFTHLIYLYVPWDIREQRIRNREKQRFGDRIAVGGDMYRTHEDFITWASHYESGREVGRNQLSQKNFINHFSRGDGRVLEIEDDLSVDLIAKRALSFLREEEKL